MGKRYNNYHKHTDESNIFSPDSCAKISHYLNRIKELGHSTYFTTQHGYGGDIFNSVKKGKEEDVKVVYGAEPYIVIDPDPKSQDRSNYHIILIARTNNGRRSINKILSKANKEGFYYKPRISPETLLEIPKEDIYITTACIGGILRDESAIKNIFMPLFKHFQEHLFLEVQPHNCEEQKRINDLAVKISKQLNIKIIHANDSHYIYPEDSIKRDLFLKGKKINYGQEDQFVLDYPDYDEIIKRYEAQGVLSRTQAEEALNNTLIFDDCEEIKLNKDIKMPIIYPELSLDDRMLKLKKIIMDKFQHIYKEDHISSDDLPKYFKAIMDEIEVLEKTKELFTMDYFLLNNKIVDLAINKYKGVLTTTSRGSAGAFYLNRILGITQLDRVISDIPLYYERYMSTARLLENRSMPDCDFNVADPQPFIDATREILGEKGCYYMITYGEMQDKEAFRNLCRAKDLDYEEFNEVAKNLEDYTEHCTWGKIIEESKDYVGVIVNGSVHPCSNLLFSGDIEEEMSVVRLGDFLCAPITSEESDDWKYLKNDYLTVSTVDITNKVFDLIGIERLSLTQLNKLLDDKVWDIYEKGLTCTVNQVDSEWASELMKKYKCKKVSELAMFVGAIRPSFEPFREEFLNREKNISFRECFNHQEESKQGIEKLDKLFEQTYGYILFQENLIQFFEWLGISPSESIGLIKKISKKTIHQEDFYKITDILRENWIKEIGTEDGFLGVWDKMQSQMSYGFNSPHALAVAYDSLYGAYLKSHYPYEYYTIALNEYADDLPRTNRMIGEMKYFGITLKDIEFGLSKDRYVFDKEKQVIYKGLASLKFMNAEVALKLYDLSQDSLIEGKPFPDILSDIFKTGINQKQLNILTILNYFKKYGKNNKLLKYIEMYNNFANAKVFNINKDYIISLETISKYCTKKTEKTLRDFDSNKFLKDMWLQIPDTDMNIYDKLRAEYEFLGYINYTDEKLQLHYFICGVEKRGNNTILTCYNLFNGNDMIFKIKYAYEKEIKPLVVGDIIRIINAREDFKWKFDKKTDKCYQSDEKEWVLTEFLVMNEK